jgi:hypothetical protein
MSDKVEGKEVPLLTDAELEAIQKEIIEDREPAKAPAPRDPYKTPEEKKKKIPSLLEQLDRQINQIKIKQNKIAGYSILFADQQYKEFGIATTYPALINNLILGFHAEMIDEEELSILRIIGNEIARKIKEGVETNEEKNDTKEVSTTAVGKEEKRSDDNVSSESSD